jgi:hypothetical protein
MNKLYVLQIGDIGMAIVSADSPAGALRALSVYEGGDPYLAHNVTPDQFVEVTTPNDYEPKVLHYIAN